MNVIARPVPLRRRLAAAVSAALVVAIVVFFATTLLFFVGAGAAFSAFASIADFYLCSSLVLFFVLAVAGLLGIYRLWYLRLITAIVGSAVSAVVGSSLRLSVEGTSVTSNIFNQLLGTLLGLNLYFVIFTTVAIMTLGTLVWRFMLRDLDAAERRIAFVRAPATNLADGIVTHLARTQIDPTLADSQWDDYVKALTDNDWDIIEVPLGEGLADSVFIEDAVIIFGTTAVISSPAAASRHEEIVAVEQTMREAGLRIARISQPGTLDGGDVLKVGTTVYVGRGGRTNAEGIRQLRALVGKLGFTVVAVPLTKALHLKSAVTALPDGTIIGWAPVVDNPSIFGRYLEMPEEPGAHVVVLSADTVLMAASAPKSIALIQDLGYRVVAVDISEFEKLEGCVTCLSVRLR
jgi:dimethylargininase